MKKLIEAKGNNHTETSYLQNLLQHTHFWGTFKEQINDNLPPFPANHALDEALWHVLKLF